MAFLSKFLKEDFKPAHVVLGTLGVATLSIIGYKYWSNKSTKPQYANCTDSEVDELDLRNVPIIRPSVERFTQSYSVQVLLSNEYDEICRATDIPESELENYRVIYKEDPKSYK